MCSVLLIDAIKALGNSLIGTKDTPANTSLVNIDFSHELRPADKVHLRALTAAVDRNRVRYFEFNIVCDHCLTYFSLVDLQANQLNTARVAMLLAFCRANRNHELVNSVFPLVGEVVKLVSFTS